MVWTTSNAGRGTTFDGQYLFTQVQQVTDANGTATATGFDGALLTITHGSQLYVFLVQLTLLRIPNYSQF
ncbi:MAG: hypothetical protein IPN46_08380 [Saprospiraceae bacterium]|nr:hypothetical protein [Saprospiraceae bacterium]